MREGESETTGGPEATEDVREEIMAATYRALCEHGYAGLTTQAIADELDKSKALLHYYYDTKEALLVAFLEYLIDRFHGNVVVAVDDPAERLLAIVDALLTGPADFEDFHTAMVELRAQAPYNEAIREQLRSNDREIVAMLAATVEDGIEAGVFRPVDPERTATVLLSTVDGARTRWVVLGDEAVLETVREALEDWIDERLLEG